MSDDQYYDSGDESQEARDRISRIRGGGGTSSQPQSSGSSQEFDSSRPARGPSRADLLREAMGEDEPGRGKTPESRGRQGLVMIVGIVLISFLVVAIILLAGMLRNDAESGGGFSLPFMATDTPTPTATNVPTATFTPLPTATETPVAPELRLPNLTCLIPSGTGCFDYCSDPANEAECTQAKEAVSAQGADPDFWLNCLSPSSGPNVEDPRECLRQAWYAANQ